MYQRIQGLHSKKVDIANIARQVGSSRRTVYRYLHMKSPPEPAVIQHIEPKAVEPYVPYLLQRWNEGCRNAEQMLRELKEMGYSPSRSSVGRFITRLRHDSGKARSFKSEKTETIYQQSVQKHRPLSPLQVARLFLSKVEKRKEWEKQYLEKLCAIDSEVAQTYEQVQEFMVMLRQLEGNGLGEWLKKVKVLGVKELQAFAKGLEKDYEAVKTGLSLKWNNGGSEGQINRLKLLKRQTYGQAGFELMRRRVLHREVKVERKQRKKKKAVTEKAA
ncbi:MAG: transposase [Chloroflexi bacterium]|uniref:Transposase n=1 Tax=Candidatus Chlorohelix allophototropha TaxID=3003348 RepID=A0A8T7M1M9_9CHLR|nr:transposase [Chloroflexota bacterium]WJW67494.1 transposase [Chloroflexota bacterium L227-S17]